MKIAVLGLGYVGCVSAACFADLGHQVTGIDRDAHKVNSLNEARAPFFEPGLEEVIRRGVEGGRLRATQDARQALREAAVAFVCVGTPSSPNGDLGLEQLERMVDEVALAVAGRTEPLVLVIRSTVFPGTCEKVVAPRLAGHPVTVVSNPEFLREGSAVRDFLEPSLIVVGGLDGPSTSLVAGLYAPLTVPVTSVGLRTAEMIKYACNAFHAVKISFANEVGALAARLDVDAFEVMDTLCLDTKLNVSPAYLKPGFAFGGSCLPKDLRAITYRASRLDLKLPLLEAALPSNQAHLTRATEAILQLPAQRLGIIGLAFKENTDDVRESPVVSLLEHLIGKGRAVRIFDPHIRLEKLYGSNRSFIDLALPHLSKLMDERMEETLAWADHLVIAQKQSPAAMAAIRASGLPVVDLVGSIVLPSA